jgi:CSLREA domain-containing protein
VSRLRSAPSGCILGVPAAHHRGIVPGKSASLRRVARGASGRPASALARALAVALAVALAPAALRAAIITVDTTADTGSGNCTLREAIEAANTDLAVDACTAGSGDDVIDLSGLSGTLTLTSGGS